VGLPQLETALLGLPHEGEESLEIELRVSGMSDRLGLHGRIDTDPLQA
jgi:hypothetical protein